MGVPLTYFHNPSGWVYGTMRWCRSALMINTDSLEEANRRAQKRLTNIPTALAARYDHRTRRIVIHLSSRLDVAFSPRDAQGLERATPSQLDKIEITPSGFGIHFPELDADIYLPALLEGFLGSKRWMAKRLGAAGGESRTAAKTRASRRNGRLGGRPRRGAAS